MSGVYREALGATADQYDVLLTHLSAIRDLVRLAHHAPSFEDLCGQLAARVVEGLGYERVSVLAARERGALTIAGSASQADRLGGFVTEAPAVLRTLAHDVMDARRLLRWSGDGLGARRPVPAGVDGSVVGLPLVVGGECIGAVLCEELVSTPWDLARQRALELVGEIIDQVVTLAQVRISMTDIQHRLEAELGSSRSLLSDQEETLRAQSDRISGLASSLVTSSQAKNHFLGVMSHELRTPLSVILGFGSILHDGLAGPVTAEQQEHLDRVLCNGRHLNQLIDDMLFFVDAETTRIAPQWSPVDLTQLVHEVVHSLPEIGKPGAPTFSSSVAPDAGVLRTDPGLLRRVLFHLLGNAFKFTERGNVRFEARRAAAAESIDIRITDTGIGIPAEKLRLIFDLFQQGDDTHARKREGIGLGLNLVQACLALLHGRCNLVAPPDRGTTVELWIPDNGIARATREDATRPAAPHDERAMTEPSRIGRDRTDVIAAAASARR